MQAADGDPGWFFNPADGKLTFIEREAIRGSWPRNFNLDPAGKWLLAAGAKRILPSFLARRESVVWSGMGMSNSSREASEHRKPSACRRARW